jgi:hypothetical protein
MTPVATATFKLSAAPFMGIRTARSAEASSSFESPVDSRPTSKAVGFRQLTSLKILVAETSAQMI